MTAPSYCQYSYHGKTPIDRLLARISPEPNTGCWIWTGATQGLGEYGAIGIGGKLRYTHRVSYETFKGPISDGMEIDHLCGVSRCINPDHLEAVTREENMRRIKPRRPRCKKGHLFSDKTLASGARICCECRKVRGLKWYYKNKARKQATISA